MSEGYSTELKSSMLRHAAYDPATKELLVTFAAGGVYKCSGVPSNIADGLISADSAGKYYLQNIKGKFTEEKIQG